MQTTCTNTRRRGNKYMIPTERYGAVVTHTKQTVPRHAEDFTSPSPQHLVPFHSAEPAERRAEGQQRPFFHSPDTLPVTASLGSVYNVVRHSPLGLIRSERVPGSGGGPSLLPFNRTSKRFLRHLVVLDVEKHKGDLCRCDSADLNGSGPQEKPAVIYETLPRPTRRMRGSFCGSSELAFNQRARTVKTYSVHVSKVSSGADSLCVIKVHSTVAVTNE